MNPFAIGTFTATLIALVVSEVVEPDPRAEVAPPIPTALAVGGLSITASLAAVGTGEAAQLHAFLDLTGNGCTAIQLRLEEVEFNPLSRVLPMPQIAWERSLTLDSTGARTIDLGPLPPHEGDVMRRLMASADGLFFVDLLAPQLLGGPLFPLPLDSVAPVLLVQPAAPLQGVPSIHTPAPPMIASRSILEPR